jgi:hypothetical protein
MAEGTAEISGKKTVRTGQVRIGSVLRSTLLPSLVFIVNYRVIYNYLIRGFLLVNHPLPQLFLLNISFEVVSSG